MNEPFKAVSSIPDWVFFFSELAEEKLRQLNATPEIFGSAQIVNTAQTNGFFYFSAVDTGRAAIQSDNGFLTYTPDSGGEVRFTVSVRSADGANITQQALARIRAEFASSIESRLRAFIASLQDHRLLTNSSSSDSRVVNSSEEDASKSGGRSLKAIVGRVVQRVRKNFERLVDIIKRRPPVRTGQTVASGGGAGGFSPASGQTNLVIGQLRSAVQSFAITDPDALKALWLDSVNDMVDRFREVTPDRRDNGRYKLVAWRQSGSSVRGNPTFEAEILAPDEGQHLKDSYAVVLEGELINLGG